MNTSNRIPFSKERLSSLPLPETGQRTTWYDTKTPGLQLRVSSTGIKTFSVYRRMKNGQPERVTLGRFPAMTVEQARKAASAVNAEIEAGANPAQVRRAVREELSFTEMFDCFIKGKRKRDGSALGARTIRDYQDVLRLYLDGLSQKKLSHITRSDVKAIHQKVSQKSASQADRTLALISSVYSFAIDQEYFSGENPASRVQKNPAPIRDRFAQASELPYLLEAIGESSNRDYFLLALLTGARRSNTQAMAWHDLDLEAGIWRVGMTKNGTPQNVPLSPEAVAILKERKVVFGKSTYVFPGKGKTGHLVEPKKGWANILKKASMRRLIDLLAEKNIIPATEQLSFRQQLALYPDATADSLMKLSSGGNVTPSAYDITDLRIHDLRRTLGSWQAKTGASLTVIGKSLNHKTHQATAIYARLDLDPVRQSVNTATQAMWEAAGMKPKSDNN
ncbi:tyrosine-type recombinase/integrase [Dickeya chrysanthemi]|uniref:tyrosine-type recombinase/integrase n=1 Tax=Dickeya chrysanthemi TaxID=556 RepID=UPI000480B011|nr:site-specific integrase [Dickeya chrysanthemi]